MKKLAILYLILSSFISVGQQAPTAYFAHRRGLIYSTSYVIVPLDKDSYLIEQYSYGGGVFSPIPASDTLKIVGKELISKNIRVVFTKNKMRITADGHTSRLKYKVVGECDSIINHTRNWSYRESLKYKLADRERSNDFTNATEQLLSGDCHDLFKAKALGIKQKMDGQHQ
jgi:hypothetical protein